MLTPASRYAACVVGGRASPWFSAGLRLLVNYFWPRFGGVNARGLQCWDLVLPLLVPWLRVVTWLILPVVICLSQRLSHACLSISNLYSETANGSLNQLSFI